MAPRSFSEDGAFGAAGTPTGGTSVTDPGSSTVDWNSTNLAGHGNPQMWSDPGKGSSSIANDNPMFAPQGADGSWNGLKPGQSTFAPSDGSGIQHQYTNASGRSPYGLMFAEGGAIEDDLDGSINGSPPQDAIMKALSTVDGVLAFGRKLHGLGEGDNGAIKGTQVAGRMPSVPGTPSDSGVRQPQPMPGPLPPTSNPFGKRVSENQDQGDQGDDGKGAIDTEEETA